VGKEPKISTGHLWALAMLATLGSPLLNLPALAVAAGGRATWMIAVASGLIGFLLLVSFGKLVQRFPGRSIGGVAELILGRLTGRLGMVTLALFLSLGASVDLRVTLDTLIGLYFFRTPASVVALLAAVTALSVGWYGIVRASRLAPLLLALSAVTFLFTFGALTRWMHPGYLIPILDPSPIDTNRITFYAALSLFRVGTLLAVFIPYVAEPDRFVRICAWGYWAAWVVTLAAAVTPVLIFGPEGAQALTRPFLFSVGTIRLPNWPFERVEMLARLTFNMTALFEVGVTYLAGGRLLLQVFKAGKTRHYMLAVMLLSVLPVVLMQGEMRGRALSDAIAVGSMLFELSLVVLLWLVFWLRGLHRSRFHTVRDSR
jgi:hypothetical protein